MLRLLGVPCIHVILQGVSCWRVYVLCVSVLSLVTVMSGVRVVSVLLSHVKSLKTVWPIDRVLLKEFGLSSNPERFSILIHGVNVSRWKIFVIFYLGNWITELVSGGLFKLLLLDFMGTEISIAEGIAAGGFDLVFFITFNFKLRLLFLKLFSMRFRPLDVLTVAVCDWHFVLMLWPMSYNVFLYLF